MFSFFLSVCFSLSFTIFFSLVNFSFRLSSFFFILFVILLFIFTNNFEPNYFSDFFFVFYLLSFFFLYPFLSVFPVFIYVFPFLPSLYFPHFLFSFVISFILLPLLSLSLQSLLLSFSSLYPTILSFFPFPNLLSLHKISLLPLLSQFPPHSRFVSSPGTNGTISTFSLFILLSYPSDFLLACLLSCMFLWAAFMLWLLSACSPLYARFFLFASFSSLVVLWGWCLRLMLACWHWCQ